MVNLLKKYIFNIITAIIIYKFIIKVYLVSNLLANAIEIADYLLNNDNERFKYPYTSTDNHDYNITFKEKVNDYVNNIDNFPNDLGNYIKDKKNKIKELSNGLCVLIDTYLKGNASLAYSKFDELMENRTSRLYHLSNEYKENKKFYRARLTNNELNKREDIFHIPFNLRHFVTTQRYSIAGVPSLYLGNTIYSCWIELDKPNLNNMYISKFEVIDDIRVIDFTLNLELLKDITQNSNNIDEKIRAFFELYPLILACGFKKKYLNSPFNAEYIIPNMLLQWISREKSQFNGLIYLSTKMKHLKIDSKGSNIVLPVKKISLDNSYKFCSTLKSKFNLTAPTSWEILKTLNSGTMKVPTTSNINKVKNNVNEILENYYENTEFHTVERIIDEYFELSSINEK